MRASAQSQEQSSFLADTFKRVVSDPTTYAPAALAYDATMRDWNSSQPFFRNGFVEHNPRFTISGRPNDFALSYGAGRKRIRADALVNVQMSAVNNVVDQLLAGGTHLTANEMTYLDLLGNHNGQYDVGDFTAWLDKTGTVVSAAVMQRAMARSPR